MKFIGRDHFTQTQGDGLKLGGISLAVVIAAGAAYAALEFYRDDSGPPEITEVAVVAAPALLPAPPLPAASTIGTRPVSSPLLAPVPTSRADLAQALQSELKRAGCYDGPLNGSWTLATRTAMKTFADKVNAQLPVHEPDQILLALVQGHRQQVCQPDCADGECPQQSAGLSPQSEVREGPPETSPPDTALASQERALAPVQQPSSNDAPEVAVPPVATATTDTNVRVDGSASTAAASGLATVMAKAADPVLETSEPREPAAAVRVKRTSREASPRTQAVPKKPKRITKKSQGFKSVSKSINKSFKSIQRSLATIFQ